MNKKRRSGGFTLIELLVVIAIIAILIAFVVANFVGARSRAKDLKKKAELQELKSALRLYYNDYTIYPGPDATTTNQINGCGSLTPPSEDCATQCSGQFAVGGVSGCSMVYLKQLPLASDYVWSYNQQVSGDNFCLWTSLENVSDGEITRSKAKCNAICGTLATGTTDYVVCAD